MASNYQLSHYRLGRESNHAVGDVGVINYAHGAPIQILAVLLAITVSSLPLQMPIPVLLYSWPTVHGCFQPVFLGCSPHTVAAAPVWHIIKIIQRL